MLAPWPIGDKRTCRSDLCNNAEVEARFDAIELFFKETKHLKDEHAATTKGLMFVQVYAVYGVGCGKGRNDTLRTIQRFCHLYSPVSRMWAQPRGEMCGRNSGTTGRPACLRLATASPSRAVFQ